MALDYVLVECPFCDRDTMKLYEGESKAECESCGTEIEVEVVDEVEEVEPEEPEAA